MKIVQLPEKIVNQIAAGEIIENPSGIVKELVENSIDAGADEIEIELINSGKDKIVIRDNGEGIRKEDLLIAPRRHATSKIKNFDDLYSIKTMGFRGEALASIFSVSNAKIKTKHNKEEFSYEITSKNIDEVNKSSVSKGTIVEVEDLFYNTPARKKYLKSDNLELKNILDIIKNFEIVNYNKKITLKHNSKILVSKPKFQSPEDNLYYVLGKDLKGNLFEFENEMQGMKLYGFIANPSNITYSSPKNQFMFVNKRFIKSKLIKDAIYQGFSTNLMEGRNPFFVLMLEIDPEIIDVNIHPTKIQIKFENEKEIYEFVRDTINKVFEKQEIFKPFETESKKESDKKLFEQETQRINKSQINSEENSKYYSRDIQKDLTQRVGNNSNKIDEEDIDLIGDSWKSEQDEKEEIEYGPLYETLKDYRIVGQINKTFVILETPKEMVIVDQHVAEEKFYFEKFKEIVESNDTKSQTLLKSEIIDMSNQEMLLFDEYYQLLEKLGFEAEAFGENKIIVRKVPIGLRKEIINPKMIKDIIEEVSVDKKFNLLEEDKIEKLASMSCKRSIKAGHEMTVPEIRRMIENLKKLKEPFNCPHGRPILLQYKFSDLEKKFKRIV